MNFADMTKRRLRKPLSVPELLCERSRESTDKPRELALKVPPPRPVEEEGDEPLALSLHKPATPPTNGERAPAGAEEKPPAMAI